MMISKKVVVIGAGAAGLMAGATAALYGASVTIIERTSVSAGNYDNGQRKV